MSREVKLSAHRAGLPGYYLRQPSLYYSQSIMFVYWPLVPQTKGYFAREVSLERAAGRSTPAPNSAFAARMMAVMIDGKSF